MSDQEPEEVLHRAFEAEGIKNDPAAQQQIREWIAALRSGTYEQARGVLRRLKPPVMDMPTLAPGYCCLGVLCNLLDPNAWIRDDEWQDRQANPEHIRPQSADDCSRGVLPYTVARRLHLTYEGVYVLYEGKVRMLSEMNDNGIGFNAIADAIEAELEYALNTGY